MGEDLPHNNDNPSVAAAPNNAGPSGASSATAANNADQSRTSSASAIYEYSISIFYIYEYKL
jgi:hypothetical protein